MSSEETETTDAAAWTDRCEGCAVLLKWHARHWLLVMHSEMRFGERYYTSQIALLISSNTMNETGEAMHMSMRFHCALDAVLALDEEK